MFRGTIFVQRARAAFSTAILRVRGTGAISLATLATFAVRLGWPVAAAVSATFAVRLGWPVAAAVSATFAVAGVLLTRRVAAAHTVTATFATVAASNALFDASGASFTDASGVALTTS